jgi:hypothetical protein
MEYPPIVSPLVGPYSKIIQIFLAAGQTIQGCWDYKAADPKYVIQYNYAV